MTGNLTVPSLNGGQLAGQRNKIINGKMEIAQRGTSFPAASNFTLDRWRFGILGGGVVTVTQSTDVPANSEFQYSLRATVTTTDVSIAAGDYAIYIHKIEGFNIRDLVGRTFTLSFWVRSSKVGTHCIGFRNSGLDRAFVAEYTVDVANAWEKKSVTVVGGLITAGTWNYTNGAGLEVDFTLLVGTNFQSTPNAWQTGSFIATANQVNCLDTVDNIFAITGVQLEVGAVATPFEHRNYGAELAWCQRRLFVSGTTGASRLVFSGDVTIDGVYTSLLKFPVTMAAPPTVTATHVSTSGFNAAVGTVSSTVDGVQETRGCTATTAGGSFTTSIVATCEL
jgi:hypothetical protein